MTALFENPDFTDQAIQARPYRGPKQASVNNRAMHELTRLPFRSWCEICVRAKSKQNQHRAVKIRGPVIQLDFAFWGDERGVNATVITGLDVLSSIGMAIMVENKEISNHATTEVKRFTKWVEPTDIFDVIKKEQPQP